MSVSATLAAVIVAVTVSTVRAPGEPEGSERDEDTGVAVVGRPAPEFEVDLISGSRFSLRDTRGKVVLVNFWGTWCAPCEQEMPLLERAHREFKDDLVVVGLAVNDSKDTVLAFTARRDITFPIALDDGRVAGFYLVSGFPTSVIVGRDGKIVSRVSRAFPDYENLRDRIAEAL